MALTSGIKRANPLKGKEMPGHKYISRKMVNNKWQYTYKQPTQNKQKSSIGNKIKSFIGNFKIGDRIYGSAGKKYTFKELTEKGWKYVYGKAKDGSDDFTINTWSFNNIFSNIKDSSPGTKSINSNVATRDNLQKNFYKKFPNYKVSVDYDETEPVVKKIRFLDKDNKQLLSVNDDFKNHNKYYFPYDILSDRIKDENGDDTYLTVPYMNTLEPTVVSKDDKYVYRTKTNKLENVPMKHSEESKRADMLKCNIFYDTDKDESWNDSTKSNCYSCALAYDMRRRGYDVAANYDLNGEYGAVYKLAYEYPIPDKNITSARTKDSSSITYSQAKYIEEKVISKASDQRGILSVSWTGYNSGHAMAYEVENGKMTIIDTQNGKTYSFSDFSKYINSFEFVRTDDLALTDNACQFVQFYEPQEVKPTNLDKLSIK